MTIAEFIEARITEDETIAHAAAGQRGDQHSTWHVTGSVQAKGVESGGHLEAIWEGEPAEWVDGFVVVYGEGSPSDEQAEHIARHDPAHVLRQCAALRAILAEHVPFKRIDYLSRPRVEIDVCECCSYLAPAATDAEDECVSWPCDQIKAIAAIWSNHPDYQQDWAI